MTKKKKAIQRKLKKPIKVAPKKEGKEKKLVLAASKKDTKAGKGGEAAAEATAAAPETKKRKNKDLKEVKQLIHLGKEKGYLTFEEVNDVLPSDVTSEAEIDDVMLMLDEMDIEVVDEAEDFKPKKGTKAQAAAAEEHAFEEEEDEFR